MNHQPRAVRHREHVGAAIAVHVGHYALAGWVGWTWGAAHADAAALSILSAPAACAVSAAGATLLAVLALRVSRSRQVTPAEETPLGADAVTGEPDLARPWGCAGPRALSS